MTIPFLNLFRKKTALAPTATAPALTPIEKPSSDRFRKTVVPNASRELSPRDPIQAAMQSNAVGSGHRVPFSLGGDSGRSGNLPPAVALALEPNVERVISLELSEVAGLIPQGWVRPVSEAEGSRRILLKAAELEKGMSSGRPSVSIASIYRQVPEIFVRPVTDSDSSEVPLPFTKVLEQFTKLQLRSDQYRDQTVPQFETPFLKVTLEDNSKFGTPMDPIVTAEIPPVRLEPATAQAIAAAEPEATWQEKVVLPPPPPVLSVPRTHGRATVPPPEKISPAAPARIPFKISPTGPDVPATERVPASSGPSVPTSSPAPTRIPFKMTSAPAEDLSKKPEPWLTKENFASEPGETVALPVEEKTPLEPEQAALTVSLPLKPVLQGLPPFQLVGDIATVPDDTRFDLPFSLLEPQLVSGRVSVTPDQFMAALPAAYKSFFSSKEIAAPVSLPLQEVLKNLPSTSLRMRTDQEEQEKGIEFVTPFSAKAEEDAKRFNLNATTVVKSLKGTFSTKAAKPAEVRPTMPSVPLEPEVKVAPAVSELTAAVPVIAPKADAPVVAKVDEAVTTPGCSALQTALDTDDELDAKAVVAHVGKMAGVKACAIMFGDGLSLAGNLPEEYQADGLCAMAPSLLQKVENHMAGTKLGALRAMTISCAQAALTFFMHENLCLAALHTKEELASDVRERLARAVHELSKKYSHPV